MENCSFNCGCQFTKLGTETREDNGLPSISLDIDHINYDCEETWNLICEGRTKGVFQLESNLGKSWSKRIRPRTIEQLAALSALLRPGCLKAIVDGKSMTQHYADRKNGVEDVAYMHESLEPILRSTQGVLVYQEQSMQIAQKIAGFDLKEADNLRKAIGKKKADLMSKVKDSFLLGAASKGVVSKEIAEEIFSWIEKSNRYAFNKSHAVSYAICGYWSAYCKCHFPLDFYCSYLYHADGKQDSQQEIKELVLDAKLSNIFVYPPSLKIINDKFSINNKKIHFGLKDIKSIGQSQVDKLISNVKDQEEALNKNISDFSWYEFLALVSHKITSTLTTSLISTGSLDHGSVSRNRMLYEFDTWKKLTKKEQEWISSRIDKWNSLRDAMYDLQPLSKEGGGTFNLSRKEIVGDLLKQLDNPPYPLEDTPDWISKTEEDYLGVSITYSKVDSCDTSRANCTCKEIFEGREGKVIIAVSISRCEEYTITRGKSKGMKMGFLTVEDSTCELDSVVIFSEEWLKYKDLLVEGNTVLISGEKTGNREGIVIKGVSQI
tara:strand:+ start:949 stop:2595 length:1647 start_codon:yes stop_codon:yes gene_type:complete